MVPAEWMPAAKMKGIVFHWSAGQWKASGLDRAHYHIMIEDDGELIRGIRSIKDNEFIMKGRPYAAHTRSCNTGFIGVAVCAMQGAVERPFNAGKHPITKKQWETLAHVLADLCRRYKIPVTSQTVLSHAEVQTNLGKRQAGKWDVAVLPFDLSFNTAKKCGDDMRARVAALL
jgi:N-acetyl-anhydromuramyl-L-alanine amidase AmpD